MAQTKNLGKVTITPRGVYSPSSAYERLDAVTYDGSSWLALQNVTGLAPTPGQYWMLISAKGDKGDTGDVGDTITVDGVSEVGGNIQLNAVRYSAMSLSAANKKTARENIDAQETMTIDTAMSDSSTNAVQNNTITDYIESSFSAVYNSTATAIYDSVGPAEIVTVSDGAGGMDASSVVVAFSPIQAGSGDPSPSNVRPIIGRTGLTVTRTGKNLFDKSAAIFGVLDSSGNIISTTQTVKKVSDFIPVVPGGKYYAQNVVPGADGRPGFWYDASKTGLSIAVFANISLTSGIFTAPASAAYIRISAYSASEDTTMLEVGSTASPYTPYVGQTYPVSWQSVAGTVYGGTLDLVSGVLTVTMAEVDLGALTWTYRSTGYNSKPFVAPLDNALISPVSSVIIPAKCSVFRQVAPNQMNSASIDNVFGIGHYFSGLDELQIIDNDYTNATDFKTAMSGQTLVYQLATPQTYQLTPTQIAFLLGNNCLWSDCDEISAVYPCDTKLYIDEKTAALLAILSE